MNKIHSKWSYDRVPKYNEKVMYESFFSVLDEVLEVFRIDLSIFSYNLPRAFERMLFPATPGLYSKNSIEPFFLFTHTHCYYSEKAYHRNREPDIHTFEDLFKERGYVYNAAGERVFFVHSPQASNYYSGLPKVNPSVVRLLYLYIYNWFAEMNHEYPPISNLSPEELDISMYVLPDFLEVYDPEENNSVFSIISDIRRFVGNHYFNQYRLNLRGAILTIEKGNDFRLIEYYRLVFQHMEEMKEQKNPW